MRFDKKAKVLSRWYVAHSRFCVLKLASDPDNAPYLGETTFFGFDYYCQTEEPFVAGCKKEVDAAIKERRERELLIETPELV